MAVTHQCAWICESGERCLIQTNCEYCVQHAARMRETEALDKEISEAIRHSKDRKGSW